MKIENIFTTLKGFAMGAANVIPGVSGGTIALITGIYGKIIDAINAFTERKTWELLLKRQWKEFWNTINGTFLLWLAIGVLLSIITLAKLMEYVLANHPVQTWAFFFGLIIASSVLMFKGIKGWTWKDVLFAALGGILGVVTCTLSPTSTPDSWWFIFICGAIAICTMILPGISGSFILVILSKYEYIMEAIANFNIPVLVIFGLGCVVGLLAFAKFLHWLLSWAEKQTMLILLGFVLGSLVKVWPWSDMSAIEASQKVLPGQGVDMHIPGAIIWCIIGVALVAVIELASKKVTAKSE